MKKDLNQKAQEILLGNYQGKYTIPSKKLYPYQWNWDSVFCALGYAYFDLPKAWQELESLVEGQWKNGMIPHIIFRKNIPDYFPGPKFWASPTTIPTSCYSQPPILATFLRLLIRQDDNNKLGYKLYKKTLKWHKWWFTNRLDQESKMIFLAHPWESGRDNSPAFDVGLDEVVVAKDLKKYSRKDTKIVNKKQRPQPIDYDRYLTILGYGKKNNWKSSAIEKGPFKVLDPGVTFILLRANRDLLFLAKKYQDEKAVTIITNWIKLTEENIENLWNKKIACFTTKNVKTNQFSDGIDSSAFLCFYAGIKTKKKIMLRHYQNVMQDVRYGFPSFSPQHNKFEPERYWRGPSWLVMNFLIALGLKENGYLEEAEALQKQSKELVEKFGFYEYFNPLNGKGLGGNDFSWTSAIYLIWNLKNIV